MFAKTYKATPEVKVQIVSFLNRIEILKKERKVRTKNKIPPKKKQSTKTKSIWIKKGLNKIRPGKERVLKAKPKKKRAKEKPLEVSILF